MRRAAAAVTGRRLPCPFRGLSCGWAAAADPVLFDSGRPGWRGVRKGTAQPRSTFPKRLMRKGLPGIIDQKSCALETRSAALPTSGFPGHALAGSQPQEERPRCSGVSRPLSAKPDTCTECQDAGPTGTSMKVTRTSLGGPPVCLVLLHREGSGWAGGCQQRPA